MGCLPCLGSGSGLDLDLSLVPPLPDSLSSPLGGSQAPQRQGPKNLQIQEPVDKIEPEPETPGYRQGDILREQDGQRLSLSRSSASWVPPVVVGTGTVFQEGSSILGPSLHRKLRPRPAPSGVYPPPTCRAAHRGPSPDKGFGFQACPLSSSGHNQQAFQQVYMA